MALNERCTQYIVFRLKIETQCIVMCHIITKEEWGVWYEGNEDY